MTVETFRQPGALAVATSTATTIGAIVQWAENLSTASSAIRLIVDTPFMPLSFWPTPKGMSLREWPTPHLPHPRETEQEYVARREIAISSGAIAVVKGDEVGLTPQASLESIYVVRGKPGMYAEAMEALVRGQGHSIQIEELSDRICRMRSRRKGEEDWQRFEFSIERARKAGYDKQNPKYTSDPQTMLHSRCRSITARGTAPEVLKGLKSVEEVEDEVGADAPRPATRTVQRAPARAELAAAAPEPRAAAAPAPDPSLPPLPGEEAAAPTTATGGIDQRTWARINARFVELGITGPGQQEKRLAVISSVVERPITRGGEMTETEGALVLANLAGIPGERLVHEALSGPVRDEIQPAAPSGPPLPGEDDGALEDAAAVDEVEAGENFDPTNEDGWARDEAAAQG